jgi:hypothetical protein
MPPKQKKQSKKKSSGRKVTVQRPTRKPRKPLVFNEKTLNSALRNTLKFNEESGGRLNSKQIRNDAPLFTPRTYLSAEDMYHSSLAHHLMNPLQDFALPNLIATGLGDTPYFRNQYYMRVQPSSTYSTGVGYALPNSSTHVIKESLNMRYETYTGRCTSQFDVSIPAGTTNSQSVLLWIWCDPYNINGPISYCRTNATSGALPWNGIGALTVGWTTIPFHSTANPLPLADAADYSPTYTGAAPAGVSIGMDSQNLTFFGGGIFTVDAFNLTSYTSCAMRIADRHTIAPRPVIWTEREGTRAGDYGNLSEFEGNKARAVFYTSGTSWLPAHKWTFADENAAAAHLDWTLANRFPLLELVLTNTSPNASTVSLSVTFNAWYGQAPFGLDAGSYSRTTVPFCLPEWYGSNNTMGLSATQGRNPVVSPRVAQGLVATVPGSNMFGVGLHTLAEKKGPVGVAEAAEQKPHSSFWNVVKQNLPGIAKMVGSGLISAFAPEASIPLGIGSSVVGLLTNRGHGSQPLSITSGPRQTIEEVD